MTPLVRSTLVLAALASTMFSTGCSTGVAGAFTPLSQIQLNTNYSLNASSTNSAHIQAFIGPVNNSAPHATMGEAYYSDVTATLSVVADGIGTQCSSQAAQLTGKLTNTEVGIVNIEISGPLAGGTLTVVGIVHNPAPGDPATGNKFYGTFSVSGGSCAVGETQFTAAPYTAS